MLLIPTPFDGAVEQRLAGRFGIAGDHMWRIAKQVVRDLVATFVLCLVVSGSWGQIKLRQAVRGRVLGRLAVGEVGGKNRDT
ncbi:hypothetical protein [Amycolatopsis sp. WGS_07]|uniref:hypothetical protein n=1 Tax=Amycolatopsis sp. WGS_07 TaxID=3076764 RepID=UPI0038733F5C